MKHAAAISRRALCLILILCLTPLTLPSARAVWDGSSAASYAGGKGSSADPYLISTPEQLALFRDQVNGGNRSLCAQLIGDLNMGGLSWIPIGIDSRGFTGAFDGNGYAIRNLLLDRVSSGTSSGGTTLYGAGLFGIVGSAGTVRHVNVDSTITFSGTLTSNPDIGAIVGGNLGLVEECFSTVSIRDFDLTIRRSDGGGHTNVGGIAGVNAGVIRSCYVVGSIDVNVNYTNKRVPVNAGGLVGYIKQSGTTVQNCYSAVTVRAVSNGAVYTGGLFGALEAKGNFSGLYADRDLCPNLLGSGDTGLLTDSSLLPEAYMKMPGFAARMGSVFQADPARVNQGYPILAVMAYNEAYEKSSWVDDELRTPADRELFERLTPAELKNRDLSQPITRAEFCAVALRFYEEESGIVLGPSALTTPFTDVSSDAVRKAYVIGITNGVSATKFNPYALISREQMVTMLTRAHKAIAFADDGWTLEHDSDFPLHVDSVARYADDADISGYARDSVYYMTAIGAIKGFEGNVFRPRNTTDSQAAIRYANATREQAIIISLRMFKAFHT